MSRGPCIYENLLFPPLTPGNWGDACVPGKLQKTIVGLMRGLLQLKVLPSAHEGRPPSLVRVKAPFALGISNLGLLPDNGMIGGSIWAGSEEITPVCNGTCIGPDESIWGGSGEDTFSDDVCDIPARKGGFPPS